METAHPRPGLWGYLLALVLLFRFIAQHKSGRVNSNHERVMSKLRAFGVHPDVLHIAKFAQPNSVYCMFQVQLDQP